MALMAKDVEVVTPTWISAVGRRSMGMGIGAERSAARSGVDRPEKRDDAQLLRLWMSERVSVASEEKTGGLVVESVALIATVVVRERALVCERRVASVGGEKVEFSSRASGRKSRGDKDNRRTELADISLESHRR